MPIHDIIDNRNEKLVDHMNRILASTEATRFAVFRDEVGASRKEGKSMFPRLGSARVSWSQPSPLRQVSG